MEALDRWGWGDYVLLEQQRSLGGQFHVRMHEDVLQAIFLHYISVKWSVFFKAAFLAVRNNSKAWKNNRPEVPKSDRLRRGYFLGDQGQKTRDNLDTKRSKIQRSPTSQISFWTMWRNKYNTMRAKRRPTTQTLWKREPGRECNKRRPRTRHLCKGL
jgi:hypothetical protein